MGKGMKGWKQLLAKEVRWDVLLHPQDSEEKYLIVK